MALGTFLLIGISACLSFSNCTASSDIVQKTTATAENGVVISKDAEPIPVANKEAQLVTSLINILANEECAWVSSDNELSSIQFTESGYFEYYGDIQEASCTWEFYEIEVTSNGRSGIWRITYPDGSTYDARFSFVHDTGRGVYSIESSAFKHGTYETQAFTSEDVLR